MLHNDIYLLKEGYWKMIFSTSYKYKPGNTINFVQYNCNIELNFI